MTEIVTLIPSRLKNATDGGHVAGAEDIYDDTLGKTQAQINGSLGGAASKGVDTSISSSSSSNLPTTDAVKAFVASVLINPMSDSSIANNQSFSKRDCVNVNGEMYLCDNNTTEYPYKNPISDDGYILVDDDGNMIVEDNALSQNWHSF